MESKFLRIRMELDTLGYFQNLVPQSIPLVERLLNDLKTTTESLQKYMKIAQSALKEKENLEFAAEPYKYDNEKFVKECNDLRLTHISYKKRNEKLQSDLKQQITNLTEQNHRYIKENEKLERYICDLESEITDLGEGIINSKKPKGFTSTKIVKPILKKSRRSDAQEKKILFERSKSPHNTDFTCAMSLDSAERLLEGGENGPLKNQINYKTSDTRINKLQDEIDSLNRDKTELEQNYKEAIAKQHEAMQRAIHLAERNKELENELKDIDQMALAVEEECNTTVKDKLAKVSRLEEVLDQALRDVQNLEQANNQLKNENRKLEMDIEVLKTEKKRMQEVLENSLTEKKRLTYRVNNCAIIEHDLNMEIDRLVQESGQQRRTIAELDCALTCTKCLQYLRHQAETQGKGTVDTFNTC